MIESLPMIGMTIGSAAGAVVFGYYGFCAWYLAVRQIKEEPDGGFAKHAFRQMKRLTTRNLNMTSVETATFIWCLVGPMGACLWIYFAYAVWTNPPNWM